MAESDWARFGLTDAEYMALKKAIESYAQRYHDPDTRDDAIQDAWCRLLTHLYTDSSFTPKDPVEKLRYLKTIMCNAALRFVDREEGDGPLDCNGRTQDHRVESNHP